MDADRVIAALAKNPLLMWEVACRLRILGPWEVVEVVGAGSMNRWNPSRTSRCVLRSGPDASGVLVWNLLFFDLPGTATSVVIGGPASDFEVVLARADAKLREAGFVLLEVTP